jgi:tyrosine-specific transport protein
MFVLDKKHHLLGGTLLIAGTSIGIGMLALPVVTAAGGFIPSVVIYGLAWLFMLATGLLVVEACLWCPNHANLITISNHLLGSKGAAGCWVLYLFLFYCLMVAHVAIGGQAIEQLRLGFPSWFCSLIYLLCFAPIVYLGTKMVARINAILMTGVIFTFFAFLVLALPRVNFSLLTQTNWPHAWTALPVIMTAFGYQNLIPTLMTYMDRNAKEVRKAIIYGTSIPLFLYLIWEFVILGVIPVNQLQTAALQGKNAVSPLQNAIEQKQTIASLGQMFAFCAMTTSFIGMSMAFIDFWADGLRWEKKGFKKLGLCILVFGIPLIIVWTNPAIFLKALSLAGGFGSAILVGIYPVLYVWSGRYWLKYPKLPQRIKGGKITLSFIFLFMLWVIFLSYFDLLYR